MYKSPKRRLGWMWVPSKNSFQLATRIQSGRLSMAAWKVLRKKVPPSRLRANGSDDVRKPPGGARVSSQPGIMVAIQSLSAP